MHLFRLGLVLAIGGLFLPLICVPLADGYLSGSGLVANVQSMNIPITKDRREPDFRVLESLDKEHDIMLVKYGASGTTLGFPDSMSNGEIENAIKAESRLTKEALPKFMRFYGWRVTYKGARLPFRYIASFGGFLLFLGSIIIIFSSKRTLIAANNQMPRRNRGEAVGHD